MKSETVRQANHHINQAKLVLIDARMEELRTEIAALEKELKEKKADLVKGIVEVFMEVNI